MSSLRLIHPHIATSKSINSSKRCSNAIDILTPIIVLICVVSYAETTLMPSLFVILNFVAFFTMSAFGLAVGYHRFFSHHSFKTSPRGKIVLGVLGAWAMQGSITSWVSDHRRHHRFADLQYDPHSPYANDDGIINNRVFGFLHAHMGWMIFGSTSAESRYAVDYKNDKIVLYLSKHYRCITLAGFIIPGFLGGIYGGWSEFLLNVFWAGCIRTILIQHLAWSANSFGHMFGEKIDGAVDESRNNIVLGVMLLGEGLHSYHHKNPTLAMNEPAKFDAFGHALLLFERLGWVWNLRKGINAIKLPPGQSQESQAKSAATI